MTEPDPHYDDNDAPFVPRKRPFRKLFAWLILIGFGLTLLAMILIVIFD
ncbi:hypothetical protein ACERK3_04825 [Phycisphaerales bacterium AB-hyl4]|uniref:Uncharacterized protein n=1 Tax=Natronomicrosphaera hydrolytica TaxID=3242702 RepID=A0ABV4U452_9BACT